jgi:tetratricopeptide (TPR) repeat protein
MEFERTLRHAPSFLGRHQMSSRGRALELNPNSAFARGYLAASFVRDYEATLQLCGEAVRLNPCDPLLIIWRLVKGWAALLSRQYAKAVEFASDAVQVNSKFPDIYAVLAPAHGELGNIAAAAALDEFLRRSPVLSASDHQLSRPFGTAAQRELFLEGLGKAGLPAP